MTKIKFVLFFFRLFPLFLWYKIALILKTSGALLLKMDLNRRKEGFFKLLFLSSPYRNLFYFRLGKWSSILRVLVPLDDSFTMPKTGKITIKGGLFLMHSHRTIINAEYIGSNVTIFHNCTIGANLGQHKLPKIGDNCKIYTGAVIVGGIEIGNNVIVGANSVITKNVPSNCTVIGNPAYIVKRNGCVVYEKL